MTKISIIHHAKGAPGLRLLGLGPGLVPSKGMQKLQRLMDEHAFWARNRSVNDLQKMLSNSSEIISVWKNQNIVGFGRATSDGIYRAVLWDVVVSGELQRQGLGKKVIELLMATPKIKNVEKVYLMTTNSEEFYMQFGFKPVSNQKLLAIKNYY